MKKKEMIFIAGILILAGVLWLGFQIAGKRSHNMIRITVDGKEFGTSFPGPGHTHRRHQCLRDQRWKSYHDRSNLPGSLLYETEGCGRARRFHHLPS